MPQLRRDKIILAVLALMTIGVLVARANATAGFVVSMCGLVLLFLSGLRRAVGGVVRYRSLDSLTRAWVALQGVQVILIVNSLIGGRVPYFAALIILAAEYFIWDQQSRKS